MQKVARRQQVGMETSIGNGLHTCRGYPFVFSQHGIRHGLVAKPTLSGLSSNLARVAGSMERGGHEESGEIDWILKNGATKSVVRNGAKSERRSPLNGHQKCGIKRSHPCYSVSTKSGGLPPNDGQRQEDGAPVEKKKKREEGMYKIAKDSNFHFLEDLFDMMIKDGLIAAVDRDNKVVDFKHPTEMKALLKGHLDIEEQPCGANKLLEACKDFIKYSVKTSHPRFSNQLFGGMDQYSLGGAWLTETLNASQYTYEVAPVFTIMEKEVLNKMMGMIGFQDGDAIFAPGGSISNLYAVNVARHFKHPETKTKGMMALEKPLCLFTSEKCHYSLAKSAFTLGFGTDNLISVKTDEKGKMIPAALEEEILKAIDQGFEPMFVNATAGTTVFGAFDPILEISTICEKYGLWLHVDGAWGGGALCSRKYRHLLQGVEKADSVTWNPHKLMGTPQQCSAFFTKHKGLLSESHSAKAKYLFQQDKHYDTSFDTGDMSLQCGRRVDVLKLWMQWKGKGDAGMERDIDHLFFLARYLADKVKVTEGFRLLKEPECTNVCFWYIPPSLRGQEETPEWWLKLEKVAPQIKARMMQCGSMMIGYQPDGEFVNFFRMIQSNFDTTTEDMDFLVAEIDRLGHDL